MLIYEYYNAELLQNTALKIADTVGLLTPPDGQAFGVLSALTNLETVSSSIIENYSAVRIHTLGVTIPTEETVQAYVQDVIEHGVPSIDEVIIKSETIPTASADLLGAVYQYVGQTGGTYEHGYIYECVAKTQTQTLILFNPVGTGKLSFNYTNHSVYELFDRIAAILGTFNAEDVVSGSLILDKPNELWYVNGYDSNGDVLFTNFTVAGTGDEYSLDAYGFVYTFPFPDDYENGHEEAFSIVQDTQSIYSWERIDVQPGGSRGRFLSLWDCTTGLAETNPPISPYEYKTGDYFVVGVVGATNYRPDGTAYVVGVPSATVETAEVAVDDTYFFDGTQWKLQSNSNKTVSFSGIAGSPYDNTALGNALNSKVDETSTASQVYGTDSNGDQTTYNVSDFGAIEDVQVNSVSVVTNKIANISLSTVATTGDYDDLTNKPTLGTAAAADTTDFATAAQGALADTALQTADLANYVTTNTTQTISGEKTFSGIMNYSAGKTYILAGNGGTKLGYWSYDVDGGNNITLQTMTASTRNINFKTNNGGKVTYNGSEIAKVSAIPTAVSQLTNDSGYITNAVNDLVNYTPTSSLATVATTGDYDDLINTPTLASFGITATASEINVLDGITVSTTELNYTDGVTGNIQTQLNGKLNYVVANELPEASASTDGKVYYLINPANEIHPYKGFSTEHTEEAWAEAFLDTSTPTIGGVDIDINVFKDTYQMAYGERSEEWFEEAFDMNPTFRLVKEGNYSVIYWDAYSDVTPLDENIYGAFTFYDEEWEEEIDINDIESATWDVIYYPGSEYTEYSWQTLKTSNAIGRWGDIQGSMNNQTDLKNALNNKQDVISDLSDIRSGAEAGATAVQPGNLATVATTGDYDDLINKPTIPTVNDSTITITQGGVTKGSFTLNQASGDTIALDAGGGSSYTAGSGIDITSDVISVDDLDCGTM